MSFKRRPNAELRSWEPPFSDQAAIVLQLFYMTGLLNPPVNPTHIDQLLGRSPGQHLHTASWIRYLMENSPGMVMEQYGPSSNEQFLEANWVRMDLRRRGWLQAAIERYIASADYQYLRALVSDLVVVRRKYSNRYTVTNCTDGHEYTRELLAKGAAIMVDISTPDGLQLGLLAPASRNTVLTYRPQSGLGQAVTIDDLTAKGVINLDRSGGMAFLVR